MSVVAVYPRRGFLACVDQAYLLLKLGDIGAHTLGLALKLLEHRVARLALEGEEAQIVFVCTQLAAAALEGAGKALTLAR